MYTDVDELNRARNDGVAKCPTCGVTAFFQDLDPSPLKNHQALQGKIFA
jgi:hypothetical protein